MNPEPDASAPPPMPPPSAPAETGPRGVGGWLAFLCFSLLVISPLVAIWSIVATWREVEPLVENFPGLRTITLIDTGLTTVMIALGGYAGFCLATVRPGAVRTAKAFFLFSLAYTVVSCALPFFAGLPPAANEAMIPEVAKSAARGLVQFAIWFSYLSVSRRVKATYAS